MHKTLFPNRIERGVEPLPRGFDFRAFLGFEAPIWSTPMRFCMNTLYFSQPQMGRCRRVTAVESSEHLRFRTLHWMALKEAWFADWRS